MATDVQKTPSPRAPRTPRKRVASSLKTSPIKKHVRKSSKEVQEHPIDTKNPKQSKPDYLYGPLKNLTPEEQALRREAAKKEVEKIKHWQKHPEELMARIREKDPTYAAHPPLPWPYEEDADPYDEDADITP